MSAGRAMTASENLTRLADLKDAEFAAIEAGDWTLLEEIAEEAGENVPEWRVLARLLARALDALAEAKLDVESFAEAGGVLVTDPRPLDAILADADRLFGNNTEKEER